MREAFALLHEVKNLNPSWRESSVPVIESWVWWFAGDYPSVIAGARETLATSPSGVDKMRSLRLSFGAMAAAEGDRGGEAHKFAAMARSAYRDGDWVRFATISLWADAVIAWREGRHSQALRSLAEVQTALSAESWTPLQPSP